MKRKVSVNKFLRWLRTWGILGLLVMNTIAFSFWSCQKLNIYPLDLLGSKIESIDINYAYEVGGVGYKIWGNEPGRKDKFKEYLNRDSRLVGKNDSGRVHNYILTKFKFNQEHGMPNVLHCKAKIWGKRSTNHYPNPAWITCE
jgi:hypothetical protein